MSDQPPARAWFRPKTFGYGATPVTWQGRLATLVFVLLIMGTVAMGNPHDAAGPRSANFMLSLKAALGLSGFRIGIAPLLAILGVEAVAFIAFVRWKIGGRG